MKKDNNLIAGHDSIARLIPSFDYLHFVCQGCDADCDVDYLGLDPSVPKIKITCPNCGELWKYKIHGAGIGWFEVFSDVVFPKDFVDLLFKIDWYIEKDGEKIPYVILNDGQILLTETDKGWEVKS